VDLIATARLDGLFGQRWKTETVNSVIKRKFGDTIRSRKTQLQNREPIIKGLVYNIHREFRLSLQQSNLFHIKILVRGGQEVTRRNQTCYLSPFAGYFALFFRKVVVFRAVICHNEVSRFSAG
jgi:hypothetical protein